VSRFLLDPAPSFSAARTLLRPEQSIDAFVQANADQDGNPEHVALETAERPAVNLQRKMPRREARLKQYGSSRGYLYKRAGDSRAGDSIDSR
jgi:hypothetical protein